MKQRVAAAVLVLAVLVLAVIVWTWLRKDAVAPTAVDGRTGVDSREPSSVNVRPASQDDFSTVAHEVNVFGTVTWPPEAQPATVQVCGCEGDAVPACTGISFESGEFSFDVKFSDGCQVWAIAPGFVHAPPPRATQQRPGPLKIDLRRALGPRLDVRVLDSSGGPIEHAWVALDADQAKTGCVTDAEGTCWFAVQHNAAFTMVRASAEGYATTAIELHTGFRPRTIELVMRPAGTIVGVAEQAGSRVEGATVEACLVSGYCSGLVGRTGADGSFSIGGAAPGHYTLRVTADSGVGASAGFLVRAGDETDVGIVELHDATSVIVHLDLDSGEPCDDGRLWLDGGSGIFDSGARLIEGEYVYRGVTLGWHTLRVRCESASAKETVSVDFEVLGPTRVDVAVPNGRVIVGRVSDTEGSPIAGVSVSAIPRGTTDGLEHLYGGSTKTDAEGNFAVAISDRVSACSIVVDDLAHEKASVPCPTDGSFVDVILRPTSVITGTVYIADGFPMPGANVGAFSGDNLLAETRASVEGNYFFKDLATEATEVCVEVSSTSVCAPIKFDERARAQAEIRVGCAVASLSGRVVYSSDDPAEADLPVRVELADAPGPPIAATATDPSGYFTFDRVPRCEDLRVIAADGRATVGPDEGEAVIVIPHRYEVHVQLSCSPNGTKAGHVVLEVSDPARFGTLTRIQMYGTQTRALLGELGAGSYTVTAKSGDVESQATLVVADDDVILDVSCPG